MHSAHLIVQLEAEPTPQVLEACQGPHHTVHQVRLAGRRLLILRVDPSDPGFASRLEGLPGVIGTISLPGPHLLSARGLFSGRSVVPVAPGLVVGGREFLVMAGPCAVEDEHQIRSIAAAVSARGARILRGGAFKPRTTPFCFQGLGVPGLELLAHAGRQHALPTVSEVLDQRHLDQVAAHADIIQVGMRNALNYTLLTDLGRHPLRRPVLLKRGIGASLHEFLCAADYILSGGNERVMLCLRGNAGFGNTSRAVLNLADIPALRRMTHLPILVDPSHAAGDRNLVGALSAAALASGADGLLVEVHERPEAALSDGAQSLTFDQFGRLMRRLSLIAPALGRTLAGPRHAPPGADEHPLVDLGMEGPVEARGEACDDQ